MHSGYSYMSELWQWSGYLRLLMARSSKRCVWQMPPASKNITLKFETLDKRTGLISVGIQAKERAMKIRVEHLLALVGGYARGKAQAKEQERRDAIAGQQRDLRMLAILQGRAEREGAEQRRATAELGQLIRSPKFDAESPTGQVLQQHYYEQLTAAQRAGSTENPLRVFRPEGRHEDGGRQAVAPPHELTGPPPKPAPPPAGPFLRNRATERGFAELDVQARALLRGAEKGTDAGLSQRLGALAVKLKERPAGFALEQATKELGAVREIVTAKGRATELGAEVKASRDWLEKATQARTVKPPHQAELEALQRGVPAKAPTDPASVAQVEEYLGRVRAFRAKQPFGPTPAALGAAARREQLKQDGAHRVDDRHRDNVRAAKSPAELLENLDAQRTHARKSGLPMFGANEPDLDETPRELTIRKPVPRPGDVAQRPGGPAAMGRATPPIEVEGKIPEPAPLRLARRYQAAAKYAGSPQLRLATLRRAMDGYGATIQTRFFEQLTAGARKQVLSGADAVRTELGLPAFPGRLNERLTDQERRELGLRGARQEADQAAQGLDAARARLVGLQRDWSAKRQLTPARMEQVQVLTRWLKQLANMATALQGKKEPDWWLLDTLNRGFENLNRDLEKLASGTSDEMPPPTRAAPRKPTAPTSGNAGVPILPPVGPAPR